LANAVGPNSRPWGAGVSDEPKTNLLPSLKNPLAAPRISGIVLDTVLTASANMNNGLRTTRILGLVVLALLSLILAIS
jgi:hypothetical protein